jgi:tRNA U34 5-carboxymethylaminomethyl modifying GTPase MnmE/TrmE
MNGLKISFAVVAFVLVQGIGVIWYVSKLDSRVDQMYKSFEEENKKDVIENQVKMKLDLQNLIEDVKQLSKDMKRMNQKDKEIVKQNRSIEKQHKDLFLFLEQSQSGMNQQNQTKGGSYSYGD